MYFHTHTHTLMLTHTHAYTHTHTHTHTHSFIHTEELESWDSFDMLPELEQLSQDPSFASLGPEEIVLKIRSHVSSSLPSTLIISSEKMTISTLQKAKSIEEQNEDEVYTRNSNENGYRTVLLVDTPIQKILCCSQVYQISLKEESEKMLVVTGSPTQGH